MDKIVLLFCSFMSCIIIVNLLFQFLDDRYTRCYRSKKLYIILQAVSVAVLTGVNMLMLPLLNMSVHIVIFILISYVFYCVSGNRKTVRILEVGSLYIVFAVSETLGVFFMDIILRLIHVSPQNEMIIQSMETAFSKLVLLFFYYALFDRLWNKKVLRTKTQYALYLIMFVYSFCNIIAFVVMADRENPVIMMLSVGSALLANAYMLYFLKFSDEKNYYKFQVEMMQQQQTLYYENYKKQKENYIEVMRVLHDVNKHIRVIEGMYQKNCQKEAMDYTKQINEMLRPLIPDKYADDFTLNCILTDKVKAAKRQEIIFDTELFAADMSFMEPVDITVLFGNLIDNAMAACIRCTGKKYIRLFAETRGDMLVVRIENSICEEVVVKNGRIISKPQSGHGIGLLNIQRCVDKYEGSMAYKKENNTLICDIVLNKTDD